METNSKILQELQELNSSLIQVDNRNPYRISSSYFTNLPANIMRRIRSGVEPDWYFSKENCYSVPADYFETLPAIIAQKRIKEETKTAVFEELEQISPLLNTISKKHLYTVPPGYLENVAIDKSGIGIKPQAKVISFSRVRKSLKYIAAAVVIGLLAIGVFLFNGKDNTQAATAKASAEVKQLSEQEIIDFLKTNSPTENIVSTVNSNNTKENDIKSSVSKMSDNEIKQFLQENGELVEM